MADEQHYVNHKTSIELASTCHKHACYGTRVKEVQNKNITIFDIMKKNPNKYKIN